MFQAYCYSEGDIEFGKRIPKGAISLMKGVESTVRKIIKDECTIGEFIGVTRPFIKKVNAARGNQELAGDALANWLDDMCRKYPDKAVVFTQMKSA